MSIANGRVHLPIETFPSDHHMQTSAALASVRIKNLISHLPTRRCSQATFSPVAPRALAYPDGLVDGPAPEAAGASPWQETVAFFSREATFL